MAREQWHSRLIATNGLFLVVLGLFGLVADILSYNVGSSPFGRTFLGDSKVIGVVEAHGLAMLTGFAALIFARNGGTYWHLHLALTHMLLGGANIAFFQVFREVGGEAGGVAVTVAHFGFVLAHAMAAALRVGQAGTSPLV